MADQISDAVLDEMLRNDPASKVAVETLVTTGLAVVAGGGETNGYWIFSPLEGYHQSGLAIPQPIGLMAIRRRVLSAIHEQSPDINQVLEACAEDQGLAIKV